MMKIMTRMGTALILSLLFIPASRAAESDGPTPSVRIAVEFGMQNNPTMIAPSKLQFNRGKAYELIISNTSNRTHYIVPTQFSRAVRTLSLAGDGAVIESFSAVNPRASKASNHGRRHINEIELRSGGKVVWKFIPVTVGSYVFECGIPSHSAGGMKASMRIM